MRRGENRSTRRKTSRSKEENQQKTQPTNDAGSGNRKWDTLVRGERSHHCAIAYGKIDVSRWQNLFVCVGFKIWKFVFFKMYDESEHSENKFCYQGELSDAEILQLPAHSESTERKSTLVANKGIHNFLSSQHRANKQSRKKLFQMNCPIISVWNKQTDSGCETSYSTKHEK